jgi:hypothetical protein
MGDFCLKKVPNNVWDPLFNDSRNVQIFATQQIFFELGEHEHYCCLRHNFIWIIWQPWPLVASLPEIA